MPTGGGYVFGPYQLDVRARRLVRDGAPVPLTPVQFDILHTLISRAGEVVSKDALVKAAWKQAFVTDNSIEQALSRLRRTLDARDPDRYIVNVPRRGYRATVETQHIAARETDADLDELLAPHRALVDGRAALETLERDDITRARSTFEQALERDSTNETLHVGLANACVLQFESTRADAAPDLHALGLAATHAREACRLNPDYGEAWATLGFVLERSGERVDALAALRRAVTLEPRNWRHQFRLAYGSWGEERLQAARRTLDEMPDFPLAHCVAATVYIAREALAHAEREIDAGIAALPGESAAPARYSAVALHWLKGLLCLARGDDEGAVAAWERELALEPRGHLYARECAAQAWYAIGACRMRHGDRAAARGAFEQALARVPRHPMAQVGASLLAPAGGAGSVMPAGSDAAASVDVAIATAAVMTMKGDVSGAARLVAAALASAPPGNAGWLLPVEPLLGVQDNRAAWAPVLAMLRTRAA